MGFADQREDGKQPAFKSEQEMWEYIEEQEDILNQLERHFRRDEREAKGIDAGVAESPTPFSETERLAINGDPISQYNLSIAYRHGDGVAKDSEKSEYWLLKAAEGGFAPAQYNLGCYLRDASDIQNAAIWFTRAAEQKFGPAQFNLGVLYGNVGDHSRAFVWFSLASQNGVEQARQSRDKAAGLLNHDDLNEARLLLSAVMMDLT